MLNESSFKELLDRQQASGLSVKDFCFNEGMSKSSFYYWRRKLQQPRGPKSFIPLVIKSSPTNLGRQSSKAPQPPSTSVQYPQDDLSMEIVFPNGTKLRVKNNPDLSFLKSLICLYP
jgi:putative transposase